MTYRIRCTDTWAKARDDYLAGMTAETVCRRYDLGLAAFRRRARKYGWRRVDQDDPAPGALDLAIYGDIGPDDQVELARQRFLQALNAGKAVEARRWRGLWREMQRENDALDAGFFSDTPLSEVRALLAADAAQADAEETRLDAPVLGAPVMGSTPPHTALLARGPDPETGKVHEVHANFLGDDPAG